jgi:hypothetical protein
MLDLTIGAKCAGSRLPSCCVCRPESIAFTQPVASLLFALPLPICVTLLNPD